MARRFFLHRARLLGTFRICNFYRPGNPGYAVFGKVVKGMDVVEKIAAIPTGAGGPFPTDVPQQQVVIINAKVLEAK